MRSLLLFTFSFLLGSNSTFSQTKDSYDIPRIITQRGTVLEPSYKEETKTATLEISDNEGIIEFIAVFNGQVIDIVSTCFEDDILTIELPSWVVGTVEIYARTEEEGFYIGSVELE